MRKRLLTALLVSSAAAIGVSPAGAAQIILTPANIIGNSGSYTFADTGTAHQPGDFAATNIVDHQTGTIGPETFDVGYWLNGNNGPSNPFITIDLGQAYDLTSFDLFNTSNDGYGDRGTGNFSIVGSNSVATAGANGFTLSGPITTLVSGTLAAQAPGVNIAAQSFSSLSGSSFRYIQFLPTSSASTPGNCCGPTNYGLNELRVFGGPPAVPEPATWAMMLGGFGLVGGAMRYRRRQTKVSYATA